MPSRIRSSVVEGPQQSPATRGGTSSGSGAELPPYEAPTFPLNLPAVRSLSQLGNDAQLKALRNRLEESRKMLANDAGIINDCLTAREVRTQKRKNTEVGSTSGSSGQEVDEELLAFKEKVERMTKRMDESVRKMVDNQHGIEAIFSGLRGVVDQTRDSAALQGGGTQLRSQTQAGRRRPRSSGDAADGDGVDGEDDEEYQDFTPTDPSGATQQTQPPVLRFRNEVQDAQTRYQSHSLSDRYCREPDYVNFKRVVHDARYPDDEQPLPDPSTWFRDAEGGGAPEPGVTTRSRRKGGAAGNQDDDSGDDDIALQRTKISTKCPLTLTEFREPVTSKTCHHSFEKDAIFQLMGQSAQRGKVKCPVGGCNHELTKSDLWRDEVLMRKIKRIQRARELEEEEEGEEGARTNAHVIGDDDDDDSESGGSANDAHVNYTVKAEPTASGMPGSRAHTVLGSQPPRGTGVVDLGGDSDDD